MDEREWKIFLQGVQRRLGSEWDDGYERFSPGERGNLGRTGNGSMNTLENSVKPALALANARAEGLLVVIRDRHLESVEGAETFVKEFYSRMGMVPIEPKPVNGRPVGDRLTLEETMKFLGGDVTRALLGLVVDKATRGGREYLLLVSPTGLAGYSERDWYESDRAGKTYLTNAVRGVSVSPDGNIRVFKDVEALAVALQTSLKSAQDEFKKNLDAAKPLSSPQVAAKKQDFAFYEGKAYPVSDELWWQKADREASEQRERIAALHRDIRALLGDPS